MHMGGMKFKQRGREEQAEADGTEVLIAFNLYINILYINFSLTIMHTCDFTFQNYHVILQYPSPVLDF